MYKLPHYTASEELFMNPFLKDWEIKLLGLLRRYGADSEEGCNISNKKLGEALGLAKNTTSDGMKHLEKWGYIERKYSSFKNSDAQGFSTSRTVHTLKFIDTWKGYLNFIRDIRKQDGIDDWYLFEINKMMANDPKIFEPLLLECIEKDPEIYENHPIGCFKLIKALLLSLEYVQAHVSRVAYLTNNLTNNLYSINLIPFSEKTENDLQTNPGKKFKRRNKPTVNETDTNKSTVDKSRRLRLNNRLKDSLPGKKKKSKIPTWIEDIFGIWNEIETVQKHKFGSGTKVERRIIKYLKELNTGKFNRYSFDDKWLEENEITEEMLSKKYGPNHIIRAVKRLSKFSHPEYWPVGDPDKPSWVKSLDTLLYNPNTAKSMFIKMIISAPKKMWDEPESKYIDRALKALLDNGADIDLNEDEMQQLNKYLNDFGAFWKDQIKPLKKELYQFNSKVGLIADWFQIYLRNINASITFHILNPFCKQFREYWAEINKEFQADIEITTGKRPNPNRVKHFS